jgi:hypothetical protein
MLGMIRETMEDKMIFTTGTMVVTFKKQNGEVRTLVGTLFPPTYTGDYRATLKDINDAEDCLITMFDYEKSAWRSFYKRNIVEMVEA